MKSLNQTPFPFATLTGRVNFPQPSLTLMVKGTFDLAHGCAAKPSAKQLFPTGDEFHPGDEEGCGSCRYESDFAYLKQRADLLLAGNCHPPGGNFVEACRVKFRVGAKEKTLMVVGDRTWQGLLARTVSPPKPFREMALRYENSYGGEGYKKNPVGKGHGGQKFPATAEH